MEIKKYFEAVRITYSGAFDLIYPFTIEDKEYLGYGFFFNNAQKFILVKDVKLWEVNSFEHVIFMEESIISEDTIEEVKKLMIDYMEKNLVRKNKKYPDANHMYSFLTIIILTTDELSNNIEKLVKKFKFKKNYLLTIRGYSEGRLVVVNPEKKIFLSNKAGSSLKKLYSDLL